MKEFVEIINNPRLKILTGETEQFEDMVRITCYYNDPVTRKQWLVYFTKSLGWEHLSISSVNKTPTWDVMCAVKEIFWKDDEACVEYHPRKEDYINNYATCLHIWRPYEAELPMPPSIMVGLKDIDSKQSSQLANAYIGSLSKEELFDFCEKRGIRVSNGMKKQLKRNK